MSGPITLGFIGFGEVGHRFARDFAADARVRMAAYDVLADDPARRPALTDAAAAVRVALHPTLDAACRGADVVVSAVTADQAEAVARSAARLLRAGQIFLDINSAAPAAKIRAAAAVAASGASYVEGAVMAAVLQPGIRVPILAGGPAAVAAAERLNALGMRLTPVATEFGRASAIKLCRSIVIKGLEALMVDCAAATRHFGVETEVYASLAETFPSIDWPALAASMAGRVGVHGVRRAAEMREAAEMLADAGLAPDLAAAVAAAQARGAAAHRKVLR
jgi:3-hydroxyisobutyrate dehydrogenase-like beta-hydroxyacid dehydrogenase